MGFLKFLKKGKKKDLDMDLGNLDVPPAPPNIKGNEFTDLPKLPDFPELEEPLSKPTEKPVSELDIPAIPLLDPENPIKDLSQMQIPKPIFDAPKPEPEMSSIEKEIPTPQLETKPKMQKFEERFEKAAVREEKNVLMHKETEGPIYIRVDRFRQILAGINTIKSDLKKGDTDLLIINEIDANSDKEFEKWKNVITDMQKKLIFIDRAIFKR